MLYSKNRMTAESVAARRIEDKISMKRHAQDWGSAPDSLGPAKTHDLIY